MDRVFQVKLPEDHPVFNLPKGERSKKLREWIELGIFLERFKKDILSEIEAIRGEIRNIKIVQLAGQEQQSSPAEENKTQEMLVAALKDFLDF